MYVVVGAWRRTTLLGVRMQGVRLCGLLVPALQLCGVFWVVSRLPALVADNPYR